MNKQALSLFLLALSVGAPTANAENWMSGLIIYGNICTDGVFETVYPRSQAKPVGTDCKMADGSWGAIKRE